MGLLQERITSTGVGSITSVQVQSAVLYFLDYNDCDGDHGGDGTKCCLMCCI